MGENEADFCICGREGEQCGNEMVLVGHTTG